MFDELVNLTPHAIVIQTQDGTVVLEPSGEVARVRSTPGRLLTEDPVPIYSSPTWGEVQGLPAPEPGVGYVVSAMVAAQVPYRDDVLSPGTGPGDNAVRDAEGRIVAVTRLICAAR